MEEKVYTIEDLERLIHTCREFFQTIEDTVTAAYLYGSIIKDHKGHDLDVAFFGNETLDEFRLGSQLERRLAQKGFKIPVDLKNMACAPIWVQFRVIKEGRKIYQRSFQEAVDLEFWIVTRYLDFKPLIDEYDRETRKRILRSLSKGH